MRRAILPVLLPFLLAPLCHAQTARPRNEWFSVDQTDEERDRTVEALKRKPFAEIAGPALRAIMRYRPFPPYGSVREKPWVSPRYSPSDKTYFMAVEIWNSHMTGRADPEKARTLLALLKKARNDVERSFLISELQHHHWAPEAEHALLMLLEDEATTLEIRRAVVEALLHRCDANRYLPKAVAVILEHKTGLPRCQAFNFTTNLGYGLFSLNEKNRDLMLSAGFQILAELPDDQLDVGYHVARRLGFALKIKDEFAPDQKAKQYQDEHGLNDRFFTDTTRNALEWYARNKGRITEY